MGPSSRFVKGQLRAYALPHLPPGRFCGRFAAFHSAFILTQALHTDINVGARMA